MADALINRVANSGIVSIDLEQYYPTQEMAEFDIKGFLFMELILKEKEFRTTLKSFDWTQFAGKIVLINCSNDAIIPIWAYMLVATYLKEQAQSVYQGDKESYLTHYYDELIRKWDVKDHEGKMIVIKGCGDKYVPPHAYLALTQKLQSVAKSIMYGEPCSTVPIYKQAKK